MHTAHDAAPHNHSQHNQCRTPYAVVYSLVLLMMGIVKPETCWDRKHRISCILMVSLSSPYIHDVWSQEPKTSVNICWHELQDNHLSQKSHQWSDDDLHWLLCEHFQDFHLFVRLKVSQILAGPHITFHPLLNVNTSRTLESYLTFCRRNYFFLILAHPVYKMWIIQEPNTLELWNKLHFEEKKRRVYTMFKMFSTCICWINI